ncbi:MAG: hypothetical protein RL477_408, partial [Pseudomonadota bacterium]
LILAAWADHVAVMDLLLAAGANPDFPDEYGETALFWAAGSGRKDAVRRLLAAGADPARRGREGATALDAARAAGYDDIVALIEEALARRR